MAPADPEHSGLASVNAGQPEAKRCCSSGFKTGAPGRLAHAPGRHDMAMSGAGRTYSSYSPVAGQPGPWGAQHDVPVFEAAARTRDRGMLPVRHHATKRPDGAGRRRGVRRPPLVLPRCAVVHPPVDTPRTGACPEALLLRRDPRRRGPGPT